MDWMTGVAVHGSARGQGGSHQSQKPPVPKAGPGLGPRPGNALFIGQHFWKWIMLLTSHKRSQQSGSDTLIELRTLRSRPRSRCTKTNCDYLDTRGRWPEVIAVLAS